MNSVCYIYNASSCKNGAQDFIGPNNMDATWDYAKRIILSGGDDHVLRSVFQTFLFWKRPQYLKKSKDVLYNGEGEKVEAMEAEVF